MAYSTADPQLVDWVVQYGLVSSAHAMPLLLPEAEMDGLAPGQPNVWPPIEAAPMLNRPVAVLKV